MVKRFGVFAGLRARYILTVLLAVIPPTAMIVYTAAQWRQHEIADGQAEALQLVRHAAVIHGRSIDEAHDLLFSLAQFPADVLGNRARLDHLLPTFLRQHPQHVDLGVIGTFGRIFANVRSPGRSVDVADRPLFRRVVETRAYAVSDPEVDPATGLSTIGVAYPVLDGSGGVERVLFTVIALAWVKELAGGALLPAGAVITVFDEQGTIVAHEPGAQGWVGRSSVQEPAFQAVRARKTEMTALGRFPDGAARVLALKPLPAAPGARGLYVAIGIPMAIVTGAADRLLTGVFVGSAVAAALTLVAAWIGSDVFALRPVKALLDTTKRLAAGDMAARTGLRRGSSELDQLAGAFDAMAETLEQREQEIRRQHVELAGQERRFRALIENTADGIVLLDIDGALRYVSPSTTRILGYTPEQLIGRDVFGFVHPDDDEHVRAGFRKVVLDSREFVSLNFRVRDRNDSWRWIGCTTANLLAEPGVHAIVANYRDITERYEAEEALRQAHHELERRVRERTEALQQTNLALQAEIVARQATEEAVVESENLFRLVLDSTAEGIYGVDRHGTCIFCNSACVRLLGFSSQSELLGAQIHSLVHFARPDGAPYPPEDCRAYDAVRHGIGVHEDSEMFWRADGTGISVEYWSYPMRRGKDVVGAVVTFLDITQRQEAERTLQTLSRAIQQTGDSVMVTDTDGVIEYVNPAFERLTGFSRAEAVGVTPKLVKSGRHGESFYDALWGTILSGEVFRSIFTNRTKDGRLYEEEQTIAPIRDGRGLITHFVSTGRDITRRKRAAEALRRLNTELEQQTTRIAGVLHDEAGQFLTAAHITLAELARDLPSAARERLQEVRRDLDEIEAGLRRLSHELHPRILDDLGLVGALRFLAEGVARRTGVALSVDASLEKRCPRDVELALYRLVQEALTNMTKHARATSVAVVLRPEPGAVYCSVKDDGVGFDVPAVLGRRGGQSLGLLGIQDRLEAIGGTFQITSTPGNGTELSATVPLEG